MQPGNLDAHCPKYISEPQGIVHYCSCIVHYYSCIVISDVAEIVTPVLTPVVDFFPMTLRGLTAFRAAINVTYPYFLGFS
jgi:hypothetical protein